MGLAAGFKETSTKELKKLLEFYKSPTGTWLINQRLTYAKKVTENMTTVNSMLKTGLKKLIAQ